VEAGADLELRFRSTRRVRDMAGPVSFGVAFAQVCLLSPKFFMGALKNWDWYSHDSSGILLRRDAEKKKGLLREVLNA